MYINGIVLTASKTQLLEHQNPTESILNMRQKTHLLIMNSIFGLKLNESKFRPTVIKATIPDIPKYSTGEREREKKNKS